METKELIGKVQSKVEEVATEMNKAIEGKASSVDLKQLADAMLEVKEEQKKLITRMSVQGAGKEEKSAGDKRVEQFLRNSAEQKMENSHRGREVELKTIYIGDDTNAGYLVRPQLESMIDTYAEEISPVMDMAENIVISSDSLERPKNDTALADGDAQWSNELDAGDGEQNLSIDRQIIPANDLYIKAVVSANQLADAPSVESLIAEQVGYRTAAKFSGAMFTGDGVSKPKGMLVNTDIETIKSGSAADVTLDQMIKMVGLVKPMYLTDAVWVMNRTTFYNNILLIEDGEARKYLLPDVRANVAFTFMGYPVVIDYNMPDVAGDAKSLMFGSISRGYTTVTRKNLDLLVDPYTQYPLVKYRFHLRKGGAVRVAEALKTMTIGTV